MNLLTKQKETHRHRGQLTVAGGKGCWVVWDGHVHTAIFKMDHQQGPNVECGKLCSGLCGSLNGRGVWGKWICVYVCLSPFVVQLKLS